MRCLRSRSCDLAAEPSGLPTYEQAKADPVNDNRSWLNRNVIGMAATSFCADVGYEMVTAVLPGFMTTLGIAAAALGWIEGVADAVASFVKLSAGWYSDRIGHRKAIVVLGYALSGSGLSLFALATGWPLILIGRVISWFGRGIRGPLRDAMLADSVDPAARGKAFGFHRAGDTAGAVVGPLIGVVLLGWLPTPSPDHPFRIIFALSLVPGLASAGIIAMAVNEVRRAGTRVRLWTAVRDLPSSYKRFLTGVGLFGLGDFSHALLVLAAIQLLAPRHGPLKAAQLAALLYVIRNVFYAGASFPIGVLADRMNRQLLLAAGYLLGAITGVAAGSLFGSHSTGFPILAAVFAVAGIYIAAEDALEGAIPADLVDGRNRGTAYGLMGTVNGLGDLVASALVGTVWTAISPRMAFYSAAMIMLLGAALVLRNASFHRVDQAGANTGTA
jgi:MFS family permease